MIREWIDHARRQLGFLPASAVRRSVPWHRRTDWNPVWRVGEHGTYAIAPDGARVDFAGSAYSEGVR